MNKQPVRECVLKTERVMVEQENELARSWQGCAVMRSVGKGQVRRVGPGDLFLYLIGRSLSGI